MARGVKLVQFYILHGRSSNFVWKLYEDFFFKTLDSRSSIFWLNQNLPTSHYIKLVVDFSPNCSSLQTMLIQSWPFGKASRRKNRKVSIKFGVHCSYQTMI
jgi:hypothetical protein